MRYFRSFESYALFSYKTENIKYTNCRISTHTAKKYLLLHATHAHVLICVNLLVSNQLFQFFFLVYTYFQSRLYVPSDSKILYVYTTILVYFH